MSPKNILDFLNKDGNVILALSGKSTTPSAISSLLLELDLHLPTDRSSVVVDHFNYDTLSATDDHDVLLLQRPGPLRPDTRAFFGGEGVLALPRAAPQTLGGNNPLLAPILRAPATAYSHNPKESSPSAEDIGVTGSQLAIVSSMQSRSSSRFTVLGSAESLEDKWFSATVKGPDEKKAVTANREFAKQLTAWTFKETGVLKVGKIEHHLAEEGEITPEKLNPTIYRVKNETVCYLQPRNIAPLTDNRLSTLNSLSTAMTDSSRSRSPPKTRYSSSSPCSPPSTASLSLHPGGQKTALYIARASLFQTSMESSLSASTTSGLSSATSKRSMR